MSEINKDQVVDTSKPAGEGMVRVTFLPEGRTVEFPFDTLPYDGHGEPMSFLDVAENFDIFLDHACGGVCACTTCHLYIDRGMEHIEEISDKEEDFIDRAVNPRLNSRLGCQSLLLDGDGEVEVTLPDQTQFLGE